MLLVTGITGHSGQYFLQELIRNKYEGKIRCVVRKSSDNSLIDQSGFDIEKVIGDLNDKEFIDKCMKGIETVFHIVNIRYTLNVIEAAIKNNVKRAICVHTTGIYSKYKAASAEYKDIENKLQKMIENTNIKVTILRPTMIYGDLCDHNMSKFIKMLDYFRIFPLINQGKCLIQPVNARDLGKAYYSVLMMPSEKVKDTYILSGERPISMREAFQLISNYLGKRTYFISVPLSFGVFLARCLKIFTFNKIDYVEKVQRMGEDRSFPHDDAKRDFSYNPEPFETGIQREVEEYLKHKRV